MHIAGFPAIFFNRIAQVHQSIFPFCREIKQGDSMVWDARFQIFNIGCLWGVKIHCFHTLRENDEFNCPANADSIVPHFYAETYHEKTYAIREVSFRMREKALCWKMLVRYCLIISRYRKEAKWCKHYITLCRIWCKRYRDRVTPIT